MREREEHCTDGWMFLNKRPTMMCLAEEEEKSVIVTPSLQGLLCFTNNVSQWCLATLTSLAEAAGLFAGGGHEDTVRRRHTAETSLSPEAARVVLVTTGRRHCNKRTLVTPREPFRRYRCYGFCWEFYPWGLKSIITFAQYSPYKQVRDYSSLRIKPQEQAFKHKPSCD